MRLPEGWERGAGACSEAQYERWDGSPRAIAMRPPKGRCAAGARYGEPWVGQTINPDGIYPGDH